jgi:hypothetical protein
MSKITAKTSQGRQQSRIAGPSSGPESAAAKAGVSGAGACDATHVSSILRKYRSALTNRRLPPIPTRGRSACHSGWMYGAALIIVRRGMPRMPSTAEWEHVARASAAAPDGSKDPAYQAHLLEWYALPAAAMPPLIGSGPKNYWGIYDLHGSIWEWVADFQTAFSPGASRGDPEAERDCGSGALGVPEQERVNYPAFMRYAYRSSLRGTYTIHNLDFRCAKDLP